MIRLIQAIYRRIYPDVSTRVTFPFLTIILIVAGIGTFIVTRLVAGTIDERVNNQLLDSAQTVAGTVTDIEREYLVTLRLMTFTEGVAQAIREKDTATLNRLIGVIAANQGVDEVVVFDDAGINIFRLLLQDADQQAALITLNDWEIVDNIINGFSDDQGDKFTGIYTLNDRSSIFFAAPVHDSEDKLVGGIAVGINSLSFVRFLAQQSFTSLVILNEDGAIIDSSIRSLTADAETPTQFVEDSTAILDEIASGNTPLEERKIDGVEYRLLFSQFRLRDAPFGIMTVALPTDFVADRIGTSRNTFTLLFIAVFISVTIVGILISRSIVLPLYRMVDTTRAIREGDLSRRMRLTMNDELGELGQSFDHMTDQLVARNREVNALYMAQLRETAQRDAIFASISDVVIVQDEVGQIILRNRAADYILSRLHEKSPEVEAFRQVLNDAPSLVAPRIISIAQQHFSVLATPVRMPNGEPLGYVLVFRNITALIEAQKLKDTIILQLSHELRTPLAAAYGYAEILQLMLGQNDDIQQLLTYGTNVVTHLSTLNYLLDRVVEVSALMAGQVNISYETFDLIEMISNLLKEHRQRMREASIEFVVMFSRKAILISGDPDLLSVAISAVLQNAYQYTLEGGEVRLHVRNNQTHAYIEIADTGVGIAPDEQEKVFEQMYRGRSANAGPTDSRGMGLGLYISRQYIEMHRGIIKLSSEEGKGTVVGIRLPLQDIDQHA